MLTRIFVVLLLAALTLCCNKSSDQPTTVVSSPVKPVAKRYHLKGKVVSVDKRARMVNVDGEEIPGFMSAMTMPYMFKDSTDLAKLKAGDHITADIVINGSKTWLENVQMAKEDTTPAKKP